MAVLVAVVLLGGIGLLLARPGTPQAPPSPTARTTLAAPTAAPAGSPAGSPAGPAADPAAGTTPVDPATLGGAAPQFASPSHNIACAMTADGARCDVVNRSWRLPPRDPACTAAWGRGAQVTGTGAGTLTCASDTVADRGLPVLGYGRSVRLADVVCVSKATGVRCTNAATGHGFDVARGDYELF